MMALNYFNINGSKLCALSFVGFMMAFLFLFTPVAQAGGGTNGLFRRMDIMVSQLEKSGEMDAEEARKMRKQIESLRGDVEERVEENGGWLNTQHDKDIYAEIDRHNKPLFQRYQSSKAKKNNPASSLGISPNDKNYRGNN